MSAAPTERDLVLVQAVSSAWVRLEKPVLFAVHGWTVGAGAEYGIDNWSIGLEYLYVDLGDAEWDGNVIDTAEFKGNADYAFSTVRASVKYRFQ